MSKITNITKDEKPDQERTIKKKAEFILLFKKNACNISLTCEQIGITRTTYYGWLEDEAFKIAIDSETETILDFAESILIQRMNDSTDKRVQLRAIEFFLKTKGKRRDYTEKQEIEHFGGNIQYISHIPTEDEKRDEEDGDVAKEATEK